MRERLGGVSRQRLEQLRKRGRLFGLMLPFRSSYVYPHWQFDPETGEGLEDLPRLLGTAEEAGVGPLALDEFMVSGSAGEVGVPPLPDVPIWPRGARVGAGYAEGGLVGRVLA